MNLAMYFNLKRSTNYTLSPCDGNRMTKWRTHPTTPATNKTTKGDNSFLSDVENDAATTLIARSHGYAVDLTVGQEPSPYGQEARYISWIEHDDSVPLSTTPVHQLHEEVARWQ